MSIRPERWIEVVFASPAQIRLLRVLALDPAKHWTEREAGAAAGLPPSTTHVVFQRLHDTGLLEVRRAGRSHLVRLRSDLALTDTLHRVFRDEADTFQAMLDTAKEVLPDGIALYLFGSTVRGTPGPKSDIDLLVVGPTRERGEAAAERIRSALRARFPAIVQLIVLGADEARSSRFRNLVANVRREGRRLGPMDLGRLVP